jgi:hypothetical protein
MNESRYRHFYFLFNRNSVLIMAHSTSPTTKDGACTPCVSKVVWVETGILDKCDRGECRRRTHGGEHTTCQRAHNDVSWEMDQWTSDFKHLIGATSRTKIKRTVKLFVECIAVWNWRLTFIPLLNLSQFLLLGFWYLINTCVLTIYDACVFWADISLSTSANQLLPTRTHSREGRLIWNTTTTTPNSSFVC